MRKYGIFLAYPPAVDLRHEGLGRQLAELLRGAEGRPDLEIVIACPSWMRVSLRDLFETVGLSESKVEFIGPSRKPLILVLFEKYQLYKSRRPGKAWHMDILQWFTKEREIAGKNLTRSLVEIRDFSDPRLLGIALLAALIPFYLVSRLIFGATQFIARGVRKLIGHGTRITGLSRLLVWIRSLIVRPQDDRFVGNLFEMIFEAETDLMLVMINARADIHAWYSPTAFWPEFNKIKKPRLMCVPDVVLGDIPVGFSLVGDWRYLETFQRVKKAISGGQYFTTYSAEIKWRTLVDRFQVDPDCITVTHHGPNLLDSFVSVRDVPDPKSATETLCKNLLRTAMSKAVDNPWAGNYGTGDLKYIFYASQFRPNKNILNLLKAYKYLLRRRYRGVKLILTGNPRSLPEIAAFISEHDLAHDVLCLHHLSPAELAACYHLAEIAVNPSLIEGGLPFTFTEALSVGTPVVMSRIPVSEEILTDPELQEATFFDPYDWESIAARVEWGLENRDELLKLQLRAFTKLSQRTWTDVMGDHIDTLDRISEQSASEARADLVAQ